MIPIAEQRSQYPFCAVEWPNRRRHPWSTTGFRPRCAFWMLLRASATAGGQRQPKMTWVTEMDPQDG